MLRKTIITAGLLGVALSFTLIAVPQARADHISDPCEGVPDFFPCLEEIHIYPLPVEVAPISAEPEVVVTIPLSDETSSALETPEMDLEPLVELPPAEVEEPGAAETAGETPEDDSTAGEARDASDSSETEAAVAAEPDPILTTAYSFGGESYWEIPVTNDQQAEAQQSRDVSDVDDESAESAGVEPNTAVTDAGESEQLAQASSDQGGQASSLLAAALGALGAALLFGAVTLGITIGRRAN